MKLVIVESPAKAKTINKYLGTDYKVLASFGHIRDLPRLKKPTPSFSPPTRIEKEKRLPGIF